MRLCWSPLVSCLVTPTQQLVRQVIRRDWRGPLVVVAVSSFALGVGLGLGGRRTASPPPSETSPSERPSALTPGQGQATTPQACEVRVKRVTAVRAVVQNQAAGVKTVADDQLLEERR